MGNCSSSHRCTIAAEGNLGNAAPCRRWLRSLRALICCVFFAPLCGADSAANGATLEKIGSGSLTWFGLQLYQAEYWESPHNCSQRRLKITYARAIPARKLVLSTAEQWQHLGMSDSGVYRPWLNQLMSIWPDIEPGDHLAVTVDDDGSAYFEGVDGFLGTISDPGFGPAFLAIWLHPDTSEPDLRSKLLSDRDSGCELPQLKQFGTVTLPPQG